MLSPNQRIEKPFLEKSPSNLVTITYKIYKKAAKFFLADNKKAYQTLKAFPFTVEGQEANHLAINMAIQILLSSVKTVDSLLLSSLILIQMVKQGAFLQFVQKAHILNKYRYPNIIYYLDVFITQKSNWLVMDYLGKVSLTDYIHNKLVRLFISWLAKAQILEGIAEELTFLHQDEITYRDLKPDNILLD